MRKYTRPEMECRVFARESILTASTQTQNESSMAKLKKDLTVNFNIQSAQIIDAAWTE